MSPVTVLIGGVFELAIVEKLRRAPRQIRVHGLGIAVVKA